MSWEKIRIGRQAPEASTLRGTVAALVGLGACAILCAPGCGTADGASDDFRAHAREAGVSDAGATDLRETAILKRRGWSIGTWPGAASGIAPGAGRCGAADGGPLAPSSQADRLIDSLRARYMADPSASMPRGAPPSGKRPTEKHSLFPASVAASVTQECGRLSPVFATDISGIPGRTTVTFPEHADSAFELEETQTGLRVAVRLVGARPVAGERSQGYVIYENALPDGIDIIHVPQPTGTEDLLMIDGPETTSVSYKIELGDKVAGLRLLANTLELLDSKGMPRLRVSPPYLLDAKLERHEASLALSGCTADTSAAPPWDHPPKAAGAKSCTL